MFWVGQLSQCSLVLCNDTVKTLIISSSIHEDLFILKPDKLVAKHVAHFIIGINENLGFGYHIEF